MIVYLLDLETNVVRDRSKIAEMVEMFFAKTKIEEGKIELLDTFHTFVKPKSGRVYATTTTFCGIKQSDIDPAPHFPEAFRLLREWMGEEEHYLASWSLSDKDILRSECNAWKMPCEWMRNFNDFQKMYCDFKGLKYRIGQADALKAEGVETDGIIHKADSDTLNMLKLLQKIYDPAHEAFKFEKNEYQEGVQSRMVYSDGGLENNPFEKLKQLFA